jgi:hypothetical protein
MTILLIAALGTTLPCLYVTGVPGGEPARP